VLCSIRYAWGTLFLCHFGSPHPLIRSQNPPNSFLSHTSSPFSRNSLISNTYENGGGVGGTCGMTNRSISPLSSRLPQFRESPLTRHESRSRAASLSLYRSLFQRVPFPYRSVLALSCFSSVTSAPYRKNRGRGTPRLLVTLSFHSALFSRRLRDRCAQYVRISNVSKFGRRADILLAQRKSLTPQRGELQRLGRERPHPSKG